MKKNISKIFSIITICLFVFTIVILIWGSISIKKGKPFSIFGYTYSVVPTDSMEPEIHVGDFVLSKKVPYEDLKIGDDIVYYSSEYDIYIIHRIYGIDNGAFIMKGINNDATDPERVTENNYVAKRIWNGSILSIGKITAEHRWIVFLGLIIIFTFIFISESVNIVNLLKKKKEEEQKEKEKEMLLKNLEAEVRQEIEEENKKKEKN